MKKTFLLRAFALAAVAVITFTSCSDDKTYPAGSIAIEQGAGQAAGFAWGETKSIPVDVSDIDYAIDARVPQGWAATFDLENKTATITAPAIDAEDYAMSGTIVFRAVDFDNKIRVAQYNVFTVDYTHKDGVFFLSEGSGSEDGIINYVDRYGRIFEDIYGNSNNGASVGSVLQDMFIRGDRIYFVTQNGSVNGGDGSLVVADVRTMKKISAADLNFTANGVDCWPQHIVVVSDTKAYLQYATSDWEANSGIRVLDLNTLTVSSEDLQGTYGQFSVAGATKGRMLFSKGKVYAPCGQSLAVIDAATDEVTKVDYGMQIKGIAKGSDGKVWMILAGGGVVDDKIVAVDENGNEIAGTAFEFELEDPLPTETYMSIIGICSSFTDDYIYFTHGPLAYSMLPTIVARFNTKTGVLDEEYITIREFMYGYNGVHPTTGKLYIAACPDMFTSGRIKVYDGTTFEANIDFPSMIAGVDFAYRFSEEFINK